MRMRKKKNGASRIRACAHLLIEDAATFRQAPAEAFGKERPLHVEVGCGKGNFACGMAEKHPDFNFIAMERVADVACLALEKADRAKESRPDNLRFIIGDAKNLTEFFPDGSVSCLYLNFSDPWPKAGHAKRRLTHAGFLHLYRQILAPDGILKLKTDNRSLYEFTLEQFESLGLTVLWKTEDLHGSPLAEDNVMTEYEKNFSDKGMPIYSVHAVFPPHKEDASC